MIKGYECTQCGSTQFEQVASARLRCAYCGSLYEVLGGAPKVVISKGAKVIFGKNANVEIRGGMQIEDGAQVELQGKVTVLKDGKQKPYQLRLIRGKG